MTEFVVCQYSNTHCSQTSLLIFKFCQRIRKESFVLTANKPLVGTLMTIGDIRWLCYCQLHIPRWRLGGWIGRGGEGALCCTQVLLFVHPSSQVGQTYTVWHIENVKSACEPSDSSGQCVSPVSVAWGTKEYFYSPLDGMPVVNSVNNIKCYPRDKLLSSGKC